MPIGMNQNRNIAKNSSRTKQPEASGSFHFKLPFYTVVPCHWKSIVTFINNSVMKQDMKQTRTVV